MQIVQLLLQRLEERPRWLRWLADAPLAVREADRLARRAYLVYQLPCAIGFVCAYAVPRQLGWLASSPLVGLWLLALGLAALVWPVYIARLAVAAYRNAGISTGSMASRLRTLAVVSFVLAGLLAFVFFGVVASLAIVTVAMPAQAIP